MDSTPRIVVPQLASATPSLPKGRGWIYQIKYDGYRMLATTSKGVRFISRNGKDWTSKLAGLASAVGSLNLGVTWLDGEVVAFDDSERSSVKRLRRALDGRKGEDLCYVVFDMPFWQGRDLRPRPLRERLALLDQVLGSTPRESGVLVAQTVKVRDARHLAALLSHACQVGLEGLVAKRADAPYTEGRGDSWVKLPCRVRDEFVVGGWTSPGAGGERLTGLLLGSPEGSKLKFEGSVAVSGRRDAQILSERLGKLTRARSPFTTAVSSNSRWSTALPPVIHWAKPHLVVEVEYLQDREATSLRHASYVAIREDKGLHDLRPG